MLKMTAPTIKVLLSMFEAVHRRPDKAFALQFRFGSFQTGSALGRGMRLAVDWCSSPRRCRRIAAEVARSFGEWRAVRGRRARAACGEYRLLLHRKVPLRNERGAILKWYGSSVDVMDPNI
jgi:hypothetical protein